MNVGEIAATIRHGIDAAGQARATTITARDHGRDAGLLADATCQDSRHQHVRDGHARRTEADKEAGILLDRIDNSVSAAVNYLKAIT